MHAPLETFLWQLEPHGNVIQIQIFIDVSNLIMFVNFIEVFIFIVIFFIFLFLNWLEIVAYVFPTHKFVHKFMQNM